MRKGWPACCRSLWMDFASREEKTVQWRFGLLDLALFYIHFLPWYNRNKNITDFQWAQILCWVFSTNKNKYWIKTNSKMFAQLIHFIYNKILIFQNQSPTKLHCDPTKNLKNVGISKNWTYLLVLILASMSPMKSLITLFLLIKFHPIGSLMSNLGLLKVSKFEDKFIQQLIQQREWLLSQNASQYRKTWRNQAQCKFMRMLQS